MEDREKQGSSRRIFQISIQYILVAVLAIAIGCDNSFSPKAEYREQLAVFAVLDISSPVQVVRIECTYDAELGVPPRPLEPKEISEAQVTITGNQKVYSFKDTTLYGADGILNRVWISREFKPECDKRYQLRVIVPGFTPVSSEVAIPGKLYVRAFVVKSDSGKDVVKVTPGVNNFENPPKGYYYRLWVTANKQADGREAEMRKEVPIYFDSVKSIAIYPSPSRDNQMVFTSSAIQRTHDDLINGESGFSKKQILVIGYSLDNNFYNYYKVVRGFDDPVSMRLDSPNVSYIEGGFGVFGAIVPDSNRYSYSTFIKSK